MITRIEAYRYKCFEKFQLDLGQYQVLVGRNGAGKTTLLDIPVMLGEMFESRSIEKAFFGDRGRLAPRASTARDLVFGCTDGWFSLAVEARLPEALAAQLARKRFEVAPKREQNLLNKHPGRNVRFMRYEISFRVTEGAIRIANEYLFLLPGEWDRSGAPSAGLWGEAGFCPPGLVHQIIRREPEKGTLFTGEVGGKEVSRGVIIPPMIPALSGAPVDLGQFGATEWFRNHLARDVLAMNLDLAALRKPQRPLAPGFKVAADGTTLPWSVLELEKRSKQHQEWIDHVSCGLPLLDTVRAHTQEADNHAYLEVTYRTGHKVRSIGLSDGTFSLLALSILPFLDNVPAFVAVEEPENGIHPKAVEVILESLQVMEHSQAWVTTHSPIVVAVTKPEHLICLSMTKGSGVQAIRGDQHELLKTWEGIPTLDVLFSAGVL